MVAVKDNGALPAAQPELSGPPGCTEGSLPTLTSQSNQMTVLEICSFLIVFSKSCRFKSVCLKLIFVDASEMIGYTETCKDRGPYLF